MRTTGANQAREVTEIADVYRRERVGPLMLLNDRRSPVEPCCAICGGPAAEELIDAAGTVGVVHRLCFVQWDTEQEALEHMMARSIGFPHHGESSAPLDLDPLEAVRLEGCNGLVGLH